MLTTGADRLADLAAYLGMLGADFTVSEPPELVAHLRILAARYAAAVTQATLSSTNANHTAVAERRV